MVKVLAFFAVAGLAGLTACGSPSDRQNLSVSQDSRSIVSGEAVTAGELIAKSTVAFYIVAGNDGEIQQFCTGTLIGKRTVLTAAHCFVSISEDAKVTIERVAQATGVGFGLPRAGKINQKDVTFITIKNVVVHPEYRTEQLQKVVGNAMPDVAVVQLTADAPNGFVPVALEDSKEVLKKDLAFTISGYGKTSGFGTDATELRKVSVKVDDPALNPAQFSYRVEGGRSFCSGDSGGPAYIVGRTSLKVVGVISFADRFCSMMGGLTSVPAMASWIRANQ